MKSKKNTYFKYLSLFFMITGLLLVVGCSGTTPTTPIINSFLANPTSITVGDNSNLSWSVTDATAVTIDQSIGSVASNGTNAVSPLITTTYTLTATNTAGSTTASVTVTVGVAYGSIDIKSTPDGAKVYLDGVDTGSVTPYIITHLETGIHTIELEKYHYKDQEDVNVSVNAEETTYLNWGLTYASTQYITLQPGAEGIDTTVESALPNANYALWPICSVGNTTTTLRTYIKFDLSSIPAGARVTDSDLKLYQYNTVGSENFTIGLYNVTSNWEESTIDWDPQPTSSTDAEITNSITAGSIIWESWDIDTLVQSWLDGTVTNYGMLLKDTDESLVNTIAYFYTSDYTVATTKRPKLEIDYYIP